MNDERHLFGLPGAEHMQFDLETVYEQWADDNIELPPDLTKMTVTIEEWTSKPTQVSLYDLEAAIENLVERVAEEGDETYYECWENAAQSPDVMALFQAAADLLASKITYRMADELIATHVITHDEEGEPMLDGKRLFPKATEA